MFLKAYLKLKQITKYETCSYCDGEIKERLVDILRFPPPPPDDYNEFMRRRACEKKSSLNFMSLVGFQASKICILFRVLARDYLMTSIIFSIYLNFPIRSRCVLKGVIHRKKQWTVLRLLEKVSSFSKECFS